MLTRAKRTSDGRHRRPRPVVLASVGVAAAVLAVTSVWSSSYAAFTATTSNPSNAWKAGTVTLSDSAGGTAMFDTSLGNIAPGASGSRCIQVSYGGDIAATVKLYAGSYTSAGTPNNLGSQMKLTVQRGTMTTFDPNCTAGTFTSTSTVFPNDTFDNFAGGTPSHTDYAHSYDSWAVAAATPPAVYKFDWSFPSTGSDTTDNNFQGKTLNIGFTWEAHSS